MGEGRLASSLIMWDDLPPAGGGRRSKDADVASVSLEYLRLLEAEHEALRDDLETTASEQHAWQAVENFRKEHAL